MSKQQIEQFQRWYSSTGHWIYDTRAEAAKTWVERGINTLPRAPEGASSLLADWIAADKAPALLEKLRRQEQAALTLKAFDDLAHAGRRDAEDRRSAVERAARNAL